MARNGIRFDDKEVRRALERLRREGAPRAVSDALNRTAFEVRDALEMSVRRTFDFTSSSAENFIARGFGPRRADLAKPGSLSVRIAARERTEAVLAKQVFGATLRADGRFAVPIGVKKGARGVPPSRRPRTLLAKKRAYIPGDADIIVQARKRGRGRILYALTKTVKIPKRLDFFGIVERTARRELPRKAQRVLEKMRESGR